MERFEVFRTKDPQVSFWLQKNGFQKRRSENHEMSPGRNNTTKSNKEETEAAVQTKEVRFHTDEHVHSKIPSLVLKQTVPELRRNKIQEGQSNAGRLNNLTEYMPTISQSSSMKRVDYQERSQLTQAGYVKKGELRARSYSSPPNNEQSLSRRYSTMSLFSAERSSNIPVLIRNNNVRLRKYSCPEYYSTSTNHYNEQKGGRELQTKGLARKTADTNVSSNTSQQLAKELGNQTTREKKDAKVKAISKPSKRGSDTILKKGVSDFPTVPATDVNRNEISLYRKFGKTSGLSTEDSDRGFGLEFSEEDSWQSYSLEVQAKKLPKQNLPSSMYSARSSMLTWLGEVNRNNPQLWS